MKKKSSIGKLGFDIVLVVYSLLLIYPFFWMATAAFKSDKEIYTEPWSFPKHFHFQNLVDVWTGGGQYTPYYKMFTNTITLTLVSLLFLCLFSVMAGYGLARFQFKGKNLFLVFLLIIQTVPFFGYIISLYGNMRDLNLTNSLVGVILIYISVALPFSIIIISGFFQSFSVAIEEAALIDGCSEYQKFTKVILPMARGSIATIAIINFIGYWNELGISLIFLTSPDLRTVNIGMLALKSQYSINITATFGMLLLSSLPTFIFFSIFQKNILKGISLGAVKG